MSYEALKGAVSGTLSSLPMVTSEIIRDMVSKFSLVEGLEVSELERDRLTRELESVLEVTMANGSVVQEDFKPWLGEAKKDIDPYYWRRYERLLRETKNFPPKVVAKLDDITDRILGLLENPAKPGTWDRRGMVVGHVQSGKTANYTGLICKAADAGYKLIIVIAGIHNNLRNQTQERIDEGFVGRDSSRLEARRDHRDIGVGKFDRRFPPLTVTTCVRDFNRQTAATLGVQLRALKVPAVLVIKKNAKTLENVINWLREHNASGSRIKDHPMLLIDDEADNASIDISSSPDKASRINSQIRELLELFMKKCYVGYTATPFANIFIDPQTEAEMIGADLFPRDFIVTLDPPTNYFGATRIFSTDADCETVRWVDDHEDHLPLKHKKGHDISELPDSLKTAVRTFVLALAVRLLRGHRGKHNSMLVNASRFTDVQGQLRNLIHDYVNQLTYRVRFEAAKPMDQALRDEHLTTLHSTWNEEFAQCGFGWEQVQGKLVEAITPITVVEVNSRSSGGLDYRKHRETGLSVIAVGGFSLSRGLTLEGLLVSYFLRNSMMYDTLMQMGRWFGYRPDYEDVCRIWMTPEAEGWYEHITESIEELRAEIREMERASLTPRDFGLKVRSHPDALIVTARNKMRSAERVRVRIDLSKRLIETTILRPDSHHENRETLRHLIHQIQEGGYDLSRPRNNYFWKNVPPSLITDFIGAFRNHPQSGLTDSGPVKKYIARRYQDEFALWDVVLVSKGDAAIPGKTDIVETELLPFPVVCQERRVSSIKASGGIPVTSRSRVASRGIERLGLTEEQAQQAEKNYREAEQKKLGERINYPDRIYRIQGRKPLLMLHLLHMTEKESGKDLLSGTVAWGISFPKSTCDDPTVEYVVNTTWMRERFTDEFDEDMEEADEQ